MITKQIAWNTGSGNITLTYQGQGDAPVTIQSDANDGDARSQVITIETTKGSPVVTKNLTVSQAACPVPVGTVLNYAYTGSYQEVELPAGQYKLQCWGAQGGSNAAASSYGITAKAGGKGGYSEGVLTLTSKTTVRIYVGGAGSSSAGGFNGGGSTTGSASYNSSDVQGVSRMGGGGGATDIRLSDGALLSRMIVAGGGSGGAMCYNKTTTTTTTWETLATLDLSSAAYSATTSISWTNLGDGWWCGGGTEGSSKLAYVMPTSPDNWLGLSDGDTIRITTSPSVYNLVVGNGTSSNALRSPYTEVYNSSSVDWTISKNEAELLIIVNNTGEFHGTITVQKKVTSSSTSTSTDSQAGYVGGGTTGGGYSSTYKGKQNAAGSRGSFGQGANQTVTNYRYASGAGGGGWYGGGGGQYSDSYMTTCRYSGGGSGWVNIAANASYRPSGYTGLQLDSGETKAGNTSFPSTSGGTETGHSGNGYARITRLS